MAARRPLVNVAGQLQELPSGDTVIGAGGGGGGTVTRIEIDFGTPGADKPSYSKTFTVVDAAVSPTSDIAVTPSGRVATGRVGDDWAWDGLSLSALAGTGSFTLTANAQPGPVLGRRTVQYQVF
ncbi:MAG: hypothetical protein ACKV2O_11170 [Acidimicrobiales bacterium]